ncbi:MAG: toll/interleukin-1 receptor domain-containing protein [Candidatus Methanoperedens sp.]
MFSEISGIKSLIIFFSYSIDDKEIVGMLKKYLEFMGFEIFLAHEDLEPCVEWQEEIKKNLNRCDIFIPLLTENFTKSDWTDQEIGLAIAAEKFIIPLQVDFPPYGFIGKIQGLKVDTYYLRNENRKTVSDHLNDIATIIFQTIRTKSKFKDGMKDFILYKLINSESFNEANARAKLFEDFSDFTPEQVTQIFNATKDNDQIHNAITASRVLRKFFENHKGNLKDEEYQSIMKLL